MSQQAFIMITLLAMILSYVFILNIHGILTAFVESHNKDFTLKRALRLLMINLATLIAGVSLLSYQWMGKSLVEVVEQAKNLTATSDYSMMNMVYTLTLIVLMIALFTVVFRTVIATCIELFLGTCLCLLLLSPTRLVEQEKNNDLPTSSLK